MIMITAIIYIFLSYVIFDQQLIKNYLLTPSLKIQKVQVPPPYLPKMKIFQAPLQKGGEDSMWNLAPAFQIVHKIHETYCSC